MTEKQKALLRLLDDLAYISSDLSESNKLLVYEYLTEITDLFGISKKELQDYSEAKKTLTDVIICLEVSGGLFFDEDIYKKKIKRWSNRLKDVVNGNTWREIV